MAKLINVIVPNLGESISQATIVKWLKKENEAVIQDETILELETEKVTIEVNAQQAGTLRKIESKVGHKVEVGDCVGQIELNEPDDLSVIAHPEPDTTFKAQTLSTNSDPLRPEDKLKLSPAVHKIILEQNIDPQQIKGSGKNDRIIKSDIIHLSPSTLTEIVPKQNTEINLNAKNEEHVPMSPLRQTIARRLKEAQNTAALLTTFNEVDMTELISTRTLYKDNFEKKYNVKLGFMSFFVKSSVIALKSFPTVNAAIDNDNIIYKNHYDIGVAVSTSQGLVVPVVKNADTLSFAEIEKTIFKLAEKGRNGTLAMNDMTGGTFTITNGGVFGSLLSTPIVNAPQSAILGMHKIQQRPIALEGQVVIRPMMYLALTYDHRIIDGREAVSFLVRIKECLENPERILLEI